MDILKKTKPNCFTIGESCRLGHISRQAIPFLNQKTNNTILGMAAENQDIYS